MPNTGVRHGLAKREEARRLRKQCLFLRDIATRLEVSLSTAALWTRGVLTAEQRSELISLSQTRRITKGCERRFERWRAEAIELWQQWSNEPLFTMGIGLYWGEGTKANQRNRSFSLSNSDPGLIRTWVAWLRKYASGAPLRIAVSVPEDVNEEVAKGFWQDVTGITKACSYLNHTRRLRPPKKKLPYGTCVVVVGRGGSRMCIMMMEWIRLTAEGAMVEQDDAASAWLKPGCKSQ
jgi:hypothetical protein